MTKISLLPSKALSQSFTFGQAEDTIREYLVTNHSVGSALASMFDVQPIQVVGKDPMLKKDKKKEDKCQKQYDKYKHGNYGEINYKSKETYYLYTMNKELKNKYDSTFKMKYI